MELRFKIADTPSLGSNPAKAQSVDQQKCWGYPEPKHRDESKARGFAPASRGFAPPRRFAPASRGFVWLRAGFACGPWLRAGWLCMCMWLNRASRLLGVTSRWLRPASNGEASRRLVVGSRCFAPASRGFGPLRSGFTGFVASRRLRVASGLRATASCCDPQPL